MGPFRSCPRCGRSEFGTVSISNNFHHRRCRNCLYDEGKRLPKLHKRLIYLDQMLLSNVAKELDPVWRAKTRRPDPFWLELFDQLDRLVKLQLAVCPQSPIHEEESSFDDRFEGVLRRLYKHLSSGVSLDFPHKVLQRQIWEALKAVSEGRRPDWNRITRGKIARGDVDQWSDRILITATMGHWPGQIKARRESREKGHAKLAQLWDQWRTERDVSFEQRLEVERRGIATAALESYVAYMRKLHRLETGIEQLADPMGLMPGWLVNLVSQLMSRFETEADTPGERLRLVMEFLHSEPALQAPQNQISALLYASLARRAAAGQKRIPSRGTPNDIDVISAYLPYCDAIFIDDEFAVLLREQPLAQAVEAYPAKIFSNRSRDQFLTYLREIEAEAPTEHIALVACTYGDDWTTPFRSILELEREKDDRQRSARQQGLEAD